MFPQISNYIVLLRFGIILFQFSSGIDDGTVLIGSTKITIKNKFMFWKDYTITINIHQYNMSFDL